MGFILDRSLVNNRVTLKHYYDLFCTMVRKRYDDDSANQNPLIERNITKEELVILFNELGKKVYHNDKNHQDKLYNDLLG